MNRNGRQWGATMIQPSKDDLRRDITKWRALFYEQKNEMDKANARLIEYGKTIDRLEGEMRSMRARLGWARRTC